MVIGNYIGVGSMQKFKSCLYKLVESISTSKLIQLKIKGKSSKLIDTENQPCESKFTTCAWHPSGHAKINENKLIIKNY